MKKICNAALLFAIIALFTVGTLALDFVPSIQYKDEPELIEGDDGIIITPISDVYDDDVDVHEDIHIDLTDAEEELSGTEWEELIKDLIDHWKEITGGAPIENAVVSDIFDVRYEDELGRGLEEGRPFTIKIKIEGLNPGDDFIIVMKDTKDGEWKIVKYTMDENGVITITGTSMSVFAVIRDNYAGAAVAPGAPDSPQTGVASYFVPAIAGAVLFGGAAFVLVRRLRSRTAA